ncbi:MAG: hypothetical protein ABIH00_08175 [Armatimonadota bacterium]
MGTTTFYLRKNDFAGSLNKMTKKDLEELNNLSPYNKDPHYMGWTVPFELHNRNVYVLVFWKGKLMKLEDAPDQLNRKYYDTYKGKTMKEYEWTLLKNMMLNRIEYLDKKFKKDIRHNKIKKVAAKKPC